MLLSEFSQWKLHQKPIIYRNIQRYLIYRLIFRNHHKGYIKDGKKIVLLFFSSFNFCTFALRKSYLNKQSDADHGNWNGCQLITSKRGNPSNSFDFK